MKKGLRGYWRAIRLASLALRAENLASTGKAAASLAMLAKLHQISGEPMPSQNLPIELNILLAQVSISAHDGPLSLAAAETALAQLEEGRGRYGSHTRAYLAAFCRALVNYCLAWRDGERFIPPANDPVLTFDLNAVDARVRQRFLLPADGRFI